MRTFSRESKSQNYSSTSVQYLSTITKKLNMSQVTCMVQCIVPAYQKSEIISLVNIEPNDIDLLGM